MYVNTLCLHKCLSTAVELIFATTKIIFVKKRLKAWSPTVQHQSDILLHIVFTFKCKHRHTVSVWGHKQILSLLKAQGWSSRPLGLCSTLLPWIMSDRVLLCTTTLPLSEGRAAGEHMLRVTHGWTDKCVHGHAFIQTVNPYLPRQTYHHIHTFTPPEEIHKHTHLYARTPILNSVANLYMYTLTHMAWAPLPFCFHPVQQNHSSPSSTYSPSPLHYRGINTIATSWTMSSIICIRFDGVKALATILLKLMCLYLCCALLNAVSVDWSRVNADMASPVFWLLRYPL